MKGSTWIEAYETKRGTKYRVRYREGARKKSLRAGFSKSVANDAADVKEIELTRRRFGIRDPDYTVASLAQDFIADAIRTKKPRTVQLIKYCLEILKPLFPRQAAYEIERPDILRARDQLLEKRSKNGTNIVLRVWAAAFQFALEQGHIDRNPVKKVQVKAERVARFLTKEEIQALLKACTSNQELEKIIRIALYTGMRRGEILALRPAQIRRGYIFIPDSKTGEPRAVPIHADIARDVSGMRMEDWSANRLERAFRRAVARSNIKARFHDLRHTFCSNYLQSGGTLADLMLVTGHKSIAMLQIYAHFQLKYLRKRIGRMSFT